MTPPHTANQPSRTSTFARQLDDDWRRLHRSRRALATARSWARLDPSHPLGRLAADVTDLDEFVAVTQRDMVDGDAVLGRLVDLTDRDQLAGRIVVQRLLPGLVSAARPYRWHAESADLLESVVPAAWIAIREYDTARRPRHVAPSLISDAIYRAFRRSLRQRRTIEVPRSATSFTSHAAQPAATDSAEELAVVLREAVDAGVAAHHVDLVRSLVTADTAAIARACDVSTRMIRYRRRNAIDSIRGAVTGEARAA